MYYIHITAFVQLSTVPLDKSTPRNKQAAQVGAPDRPDDWLSGRSRIARWGESTVPHVVLHGRSSGAWPDRLDGWVDEPINERPDEQEARDDARSAHFERGGEATTGRSRRHEPVAAPVCRADDARSDHWRTGAPLPARRDAAHSEQARPLGQPYDRHPGPHDQGPRESPDPLQPRRAPGRDCRKAQAGRPERLPAITRNRRRASEGSRVLPLSACPWSDSSARMASSTGTREPAAGDRARAPRVRRGPGSVRVGRPARSRD